MSVFHDQHYQTPEFKEFLAAVQETVCPSPDVAIRTIYAAITRARSNPKLTPRQVFINAHDDATQSIVRIHDEEPIVDMRACPKREGDQLYPGDLVKAGDETIFREDWRWFIIISVHENHSVTGFYRDDPSRTPRNMTPQMVRVATTDEWQQFKYSSQG